MNELTEKEAVTKWCPYRNSARFLDEKAPRFTNDNVDNCIASRCLMWRWLGVINSGPDVYGYCSLPGKP